MDFASRGKFRHDPETLYRAHIALVTACVAYESDPLRGAKLNKGGKDLLDALVRRDPQTADAFMDRLFVRPDFSTAAMEPSIQGDAKLLEWITVALNEMLGRWHTVPA